MKWVDMPFSQMPPALASHRIAAALLAEPQVTIAKDPDLVRPQIDACVKYGALTKPVHPEELFAPQVRV